MGLIDVRVVVQCDFAGCEQETSVRGMGIPTPGNPMNPVALALHLAQELAREGWSMDAPVEEDGDFRTHCWQHRGGVFQPQPSRPVLSHTK